MAERFPINQNGEFENRKRDLLRRIEDIKYKILRLEKDNMEEVDETVLTIRSGLQALSMTLSRQYTQAVADDPSNDDTASDNDED